MIVLLREIVSDMATGPSDPEFFWEVLGSFGGERMWECVDNLNQTDDITWQIDEMKNNTIMFYMEKSYHRKLTLKVS